MGERLGRIVLLLMGTVLVLVGLNGLVAPRTLLAPVGILLAEVSALSEARATYGGMHLGMGLFFLITGINPGLRTVGLAAASAFLGGLVFGRMTSAVVDGAPGNFVGLLMATELVGAILALLALLLRPGRAA